jgi:hypothetical protein
MLSILVSFLNGDQYAGLSLMTGMLPGQRDLTLLFTIISQECMRGQMVYELENKNQTK